MRLQQQHKAIQAVLNGEMIDDQFVRESYLEEPFIYWPNAELQISPNRHIQLDAFLLTQNFSCIFEVKNMRDTIKFLKNPFQLSQSVEGNEKIYECPQSQVILASNSIQHLFDKPLHSKITFSNMNTKIKQQPIIVDVLFPKPISNYLEQLDKNPTVLKMQEFENVENQLKTMNKPYNSFPLLKKFNHTTEIIEGIICRCGNIIVLKANPVNHCPVCGCSKKKFIEQAMHDWFIIFNSTITNEQCREFLGIENKNYISKLFSHMNLKVEGNTWNRVYHYDYQNPLFIN